MFGSIWVGTVHRGAGDVCKGSALAGGAANPKIKPKTTAMYLYGIFILGANVGGSRALSYIHY